MILYHTSDKIIEPPDIKFSRTYLDFEKGFYTTPNQSQAEKYAKRFFKEGRQAYLNIYEFNDNQIFFHEKHSKLTMENGWIM